MATMATVDPDTFRALTASQPPGSQGGWEQRLALGATFSEAKLRNCLYLYYSVLIGFYWVQEFAIDMAQAPMLEMSSPVRPPMPRGCLIFSANWVV